MKKLFFLILALISIYNTYESYAVPGEYKNLIDLANLYQNGSDYVSTKKSINITPNVTYTFVVDYDAVEPSVVDDGINDEFVTMGFLDDLGKWHYIKGAVDESNRRIYIEVSFESTTLGLEVPYNFNTENIIFYEGKYSDFKGYFTYQNHLYAYDYEATFTNKREVTEDNMHELVTFINASDETVAHQSKSFDLDFQHVTPGVYTMIYQALASNQQTYAFLKINVVDDEAPTLTSNMSIVVKTFDYVKIETILANLIYEDNFSSREEITLVVVSDSYTPNQGKVGDYVVVIKLIDQYDNESIHTLNIQSQTHIGPTIHGPSFLGINTEELNDLENHLRQFIYAKTHNEELDVEVIYDIPQNIENIKQTFEVKLSAVDRFGNKSTKTVTIHLYPTNNYLDVIFAQTVIKIDTQANLNEAQLIAEIKKSLGDDAKDMKLSIVHNGYKGNEDQSGTYLLEVKYVSDGIEKIQTIAVEVQKAPQNIENIIYMALMTLMIVGLAFGVHKSIKHVKIKKKVLKK